MSYLNPSYVLVISGGPMPECIDAIKEYAANASAIYCADSGVDYARKAGVPITKVYGDFDSISKEGMDYIKSSGIPMEVFPCEKDMTDTELVISSLDDNTDVVVFCSLKGRIDHVMANIMMCSSYSSRERRILLTDGNAKVFYLKDNDSLDYVSSEKRVEVITLLPLDFNEEVKGVTTKGLYYELNDASLKYGSSLGVSNRFVNPGTPSSVSINAGNMGVIVVPEE